MSDNKFDEGIKNILRDHEGKVPDDMWQRILDKKDMDRKGMAFFFRMFRIPLLLLAAIGAGYFLIENREANQGNTLPGQTEIKTKKASPLQNPVRHDSTGMTPAAASMNSSASFAFHPTKEKAKSDNNIKSDKNIKSERDKMFPSATVKKNTVPAESAGAIAIANTVRKEDSVNKYRMSDSLNKHSDSAKIISPAQTTDAVTKNKKNRTGGKWWLDVYISPDIPFSTITSNSAPTQYETEHLSYTIGARINRAFGEHFSGAIGIQYSQINTNGFDSAVQYLRSRFYSIDLPVMAGYGVGDDQFRTTFHAGVIFNLYSWNNLNAGSSSDLYKTNDGLSLYAGINFSKKISDRLSVFAEPYYRYRLSTMTKSSANFNQYFDILGLSLGIHYHFKKASP